jgi:uncharacterized membrane protein
VTDTKPDTRRGVLGLPMTILALVGTGIAGYLSAVRLTGGNAVCDASHGCDVVAQSPYAVVLGIPVAYLGLAFSLVLLAFAATWWWRADRRALQGAWALLLLGTLFVAYLTFLELFVIKAVCIWCASFAITIVAGLAVGALALRRAGEEATGPSRTR